MTSTYSDAGSTLSTETIAGIVVGVVVGAALVVTACFYLRHWRRSRGKFTRLRKGRRSVDAEEEFVSRGPSFTVHDRRGGYGHGQQPSVSLEPLLLPSPPRTPRDVPAVPAPQIPQDWSHLPPILPNTTTDWSYLPPVLPNTTTDTSYLSLYDTDDPFARIQRAILPTCAAHHMPASSRRVSHEVPLEQYSRLTPKNPGPSTPLFINRTLIRSSGPDFFSGRTSTSPFSSADLPQSISSRTGSDTVHLFSDAAPPSPPPKPRISVLSPLPEHTTLKESREEAYQPRIANSEVDSNSPESIYSQESAQHASNPPDPLLPTQLSRRGRASQRYSFTLKPSELSPVIEGSTSMNEPPSHDVSTNSEIEKKPSRTFSELERSSSSLSVAISHSAPSTAPECTSLPLLSCNNTFGKSGSAPSTISPSSSRATRYPSLTPSSLAPSSSSSNPHSDSATEWHRPPAGLAALKGLQLELPNPHSQALEIPDVPAIPLAHRPPLAAGKKCEEALHKAHLRAHSPGSVPEVERRPIVQCGIASIDVTL
ncbi:hypothetical protein EDB19DRAFT_1909370 [Suillus lakei]|nr:hypothetical protein EDB19DRAFT_1909370 [Suillus lakei]